MNTPLPMSMMPTPDEVNREHTRRMQQRHLKALHVLTACIEGAIIPTEVSKSMDSATMADRAFARSVEKSAALLTTLIKRGTATEAEMDAMVKAALFEAATQAARHEDLAGELRIQAYQQLAKSRTGDVYARMTDWPVMPPALAEWVERRRPDFKTIEADQDDETGGTVDKLKDAVPTLHDVVRDAGGTLLFEEDGVRVYEVKSVEIAIDQDGEFLAKDEDGTVTGNSVDDLEEYLNLLMQGE